MARYQYKTSHDKAVVRGSQSLVANHQEQKNYTRGSSRTSYREPTKASAKSGSRTVKKRVIKRYMILKSVQYAKNIKNQNKNEQDESEKQTVEAVNKAVTKIEQYAENTVINTISAVPYVARQTKKLYTAGRNHAERSRAVRIYMAKAKSNVYRTARKYRGADGKIIYRFSYQQTDQPNRIKRTSLNKKKYYVAKREKLKTGERVRKSAASNELQKHQPSNKAAQRKAAGQKEYLVSGRTEGMARTYSPSAVRAAEGSAASAQAAVPKGKTQAVRMQYGLRREVEKAAAQRKSNAYQLRAKKAGIRKLQRKQAEVLRKSQQAVGAAALKRGAASRVGQALSRIANLAKGKVVVIGAVCVVLCCMIMAPVSLFASAVGILFADENASAMQNANLSTVRQAYADAEAEWYTGVLRGNYDRIDINGMKAKAEDVLAVFSVKLTEFDKLDAMSMDKEQCKVLKKVFNKMNPYTKSYKTEDGERVLKVYISGRTADEGADAFHFKRSHKNIMNELLEDYPNELRNLLYGGGGTGGYPGAPIVGEKYEALMQEAQKYIGYPYVYGGSSPSTSFDCSGYICWVYTHSGVYNLPRTTAWGIYQQCKPVSPSEAQPGDLIFFEKTYQFHEPVTHVGIYVGNGKMLHCGNPIGYADVTSAYWSSKFYGYGRLG